MKQTPERTLGLLERLSRLLARERDASDIKPVQWEVLQYLGRANRFSRTPSAITTYLGSTKGTVSQTVIALERRGFVKRRLSATDRRVSTLELTAAGKRTLLNDPRAAMLDAVSNLSVTAQKQLEAHLTSLLQARLAEQNGQMFGLCHSCRHFEANAGKPHRCALLEVDLSEKDSQLICIEQVES